MYDIDIVMFNFECILKSTTFLLHVNTHFKFLISHFTSFYFIDFLTILIIANFTNFFLLSFILTFKRSDSLFCLFAFTSEIFFFHFFFLFLVVVFSA